VNPSTDMTLQILKGQLATEQGLETTYYYQWQCELYGTAVIMSRQGAQAAANMIGEAMSGRQFR